MMLHLILHFSEREGDTGKLKNVQNLVQHSVNSLEIIVCPQKILV